MILFVVILYSVTANIDKLGVQATSPIFWAFIVHLLTSTVLFGVMVVKTENWMRSLQAEYRSLVVLGLLGGVSIVFQMTALTETLAMYVTAIKRLSIPIAVALSYFLYEEDNPQGRMLGSVLIVVGSALITLS